MYPAFGWRWLGFRLLRNGSGGILAWLFHGYFFSVARLNSTLCLPMARYPFSNCLGTV